MKLLSTLLFISVMGIYPVHQIVDVTSDKQDIASQPWESPAEGIKIALSLHSEKESKTVFLKIYINNTSNSPKICIIDSSEAAFQIWTLDAKGVWQPLRNYNSPRIQMAAPVTIDKNHAISHIIDLSPEEFTLISNHKTKCIITIWDHINSNYERSNVESSPKILKVK